MHIGSYYVVMITTIKPLTVAKQIIQSLKFYFLLQLEAKTSVETLLQ